MPLQGLTIALIADLHFRAPRERHSRILEALEPLDIDILAITGDLMTQPGSESGAHQFVIQLLQAANPNLGAFGVFGNHDSPNLRKRLHTLPITFLHNNAYVHHRLPLTILGLDTPYLSP
ncbi:MAG: metallophosphoesterase, partial [Planctomycetota bacterium]